MYINHRHSCGTQWGTRKKLLLCEPSNPDSWHPVLSGLTPSLCVVVPAQLGSAGLSWLIWDWLGLGRPFLVEPCLAEPSRVEPSGGNTSFSSRALLFGQKVGDASAPFLFSGHSHATTKR